MNRAIEAKLQSALGALAALAAVLVIIGEVALLVALCAEPAVRS